MKTIFTVGAVVLATCLLSGCVNEQKVNQLASNVQGLSSIPLPNHIQHFTLITDTTFHSS